MNIQRKADIHKLLAGANKTWSCIEVDKCKEICEDLASDIWEDLKKIVPKITADLPIWTIEGGRFHLKHYATDNLDDCKVVIFYCIPVITRADPPDYCWWLYEDCAWLYVDGFGDVPFRCLWLKVNNDGSTELTLPVGKVESPNLAELTEWARQFVK